MLRFFNFCSVQRRKELLFFTANAWEESVWTSVDVHKGLLHHLLMVSRVCALHDLHIHIRRDLVAVGQDLRFCDHNFLHHHLFSYLFNDFVGFKQHIALETSVLSLFRCVLFLIIRVRAGVVSTWRHHQRIFIFLRGRSLQILRCVFIHRNHWFFAPSVVLVLLFVWFHRHQVCYS